MDCDRRRVFGPELLGVERHQPGRARRSRRYASDRVQHSVRPTLFGDGYIGSGVDLPAPKSEMTASRRVSAVAAAVFVMALPGIVGLIHAIDHLRRDAAYQDILYIRSPQALKRMSLGYTGLFADLYWTRAVQYFGYQHHQHSKDFSLLAPLLQIATQLDPKLLPAYQFGNNFLAPRPPNGAGQPEEAITLAEHGIRNNPDSWKLYYGLGFIYYTEMKDYSKAAEAFASGARVPGAHPFLRILAARMAQHAGEFETARMLWTTTYQTSQDKDIQRNAVDHLRALHVDEDVTQLEKLVGIYREHVGRTPGNMTDLARAGLIGGVPLDPTGQPYKFTADGRVEVRDPERILYITKGLPPGVEPPQPKSHFSETGSCSGRAGTRGASSVPTRDRQLSPSR